MAGLIVHAVYQRLVSTAHMRDIQFNRVPISHFESNKVPGSLHGVFNLAVGFYRYMRGIQSPNKVQDSLSRST